MNSARVYGRVMKNSERQQSFLWRAFFFRDSCTLSIDILSLGSFIF